MSFCISENLISFHNKFSYAEKNKKNDNIFNIFLNLCFINKLK